MIDELIREIADLGCRITISRSSLQGAKVKYNVHVERRPRGFTAIFQGCSIEEALQAAHLIVMRRAGERKDGAM